MTKKEQSTEAKALKTLNASALLLPVQVSGTQLVEAVYAALNPENASDDSGFNRTVAFIAALELEMRSSDLTVALANHFIAEVRKSYAADGEAFNFEEVFAEGLKG